MAMFRTSYVSQAGMADVRKSTCHLGANALCA